MIKILLLSLAYRVYHIGIQKSFFCGEEWVIYNYGDPNYNFCRRKLREGDGPCLVWIFQRAWGLPPNFFLVKTVYIIKGIISKKPYKTFNIIFCVCDQSVQKQFFLSSYWKHKSMNFIYLTNKTWGLCHNFVCQSLLKC